MQEEQRQLLSRSLLQHSWQSDSNNVFAVGFRTLPPDNSGVPHILEHTTLCGSTVAIVVCID